MDEHKLSAETLSGNRPTSIVKEVAFLISVGDKVCRFVSDGWPHFRCDLCDLMERCDKERKKNHGLTTIRINDNLPCMSLCGHWKEVIGKDNSDGNSGER